MSRIASRLRSSNPGWSVGMLSVLLCAVFLAAGYAKFDDAAQVVAIFDEIGRGTRFHDATGIIEIAGAFGLLIGAMRFYAALLLAGTMAGAALTHLLLIGGNPVPAIVLFALTAMVAYATRPEDVAGHARLSGA